MIQLIRTTRLHLTRSLTHPPVSSQVLGQVGKVLKVYGDGDLRVAFGGQTWTFNPACLCAQPVEVDANLMTAENPSESGSKASRQGREGFVSRPPACSPSACPRPPAAVLAAASASAEHCFAVNPFLHSCCLCTGCDFLGMFLSTANPPLSAAVLCSVLHAGCRKFRVDVSTKGSWGISARLNLICACLC